MIATRSLAHPCTETPELLRSATAVAALLDYEGRDALARAADRENSWSDYFDLDTEVVTPTTPAEIPAAVHEAVAAVPHLSTDWLAEGTDLHGDVVVYATEIVAYVMDTPGDREAIKEVLKNLDLIRAHDRDSFRNRAEWWGDVNGFTGISVIYGDGAIAVSVSTGAGMLTDAAISFAWVLEGFPGLAATVLVTDLDTGLQETYTRS